MRFESLTSCLKQANSTAPLKYFSCDFWITHHMPNNSWRYSVPSRPDKYPSLVQVILVGCGYSPPSVPLDFDFRQNGSNISIWTSCFRHHLSLFNSHSNLKMSHMHHKSDQKAEEMTLILLVSMSLSWKSTTLNLMLCGATHKILA